MHYVEIFVALCGIALLAIGYRKNERKTMATAGIVLMVAGTIGHFADKLDHPAATAAQASIAPTPGP